MRHVNPGALAHAPRAILIGTRFDLGSAFGVEGLHAALSFYTPVRHIFRYTIRPGVTIDAEAVVCRDPQRAFIALRAAAGLDGTVEDLDTIAGTVGPTLDFEILGVTDDCRAAAAELVIETREGSRFRALRVGEAENIDANGNVSCPELNVASAALFGE